MPGSDPLGPDATEAAARLLLEHWAAGTRLPRLPDHCRPADRTDGYRIQKRLVALSQQPVVGWKIAATSTVGQQHIGVDGPLAGSLLQDRVLENGAIVPLAGNHMRVTEAEFAFQFSRALPQRPEPYTEDEVLAAIGAMHPTIEVPDSRYEDFTVVGAPHLIADNACACWLVIGPAARVSWRNLNVAAHQVRATLNGRPAAEGAGRNVLGSPVNALLWVANELRVYADGLHAGDLVTTGTCIVPVNVAPGDSFEADFGALGTVTASMA